MDHAIETDDPPAPATIFLSFDLMQWSSQLRWDAISENKDIYCREGPGAGALCLKPKQPVNFQVTGGCKQDGWKFGIVECYITTSPMRIFNEDTKELIFSPPSPFLPGQENKVIGSSIRPINFPTGTYPLALINGYYKLELISEKYLHVIQKSAGSSLESGLDPIPNDGPQVGRWDMFFLLAVSVITPKNESYIRVFVFDPETEVGNGLQ